MTYRRPIDRPAIRRVIRPGGLVVIVIPATQEARIQLQQTSDDGGGAAATGEARTVAYLNSAQPWINLDFPTDGLLRFFRARHVGDGGDPSPWTAWSEGTAPGSYATGDGDSEDHGSGNGADNRGGTLDSMRFMLDRLATGYGSGLPKILAIVPDVTASGVVSVTVWAQDAGSVKIAHSTSGYPTLATVQAQTAQAVTDGHYASTGLLNLAPGESAFISVLAYLEADGTGSESTLGKMICDEHTEIIYGTTTIADGFSAARNTAAPENGSVVLTADGAFAYSNLEDANTEETTYRAYFDIDATGITYLCTVTLYYSTAATGGAWVEASSKVYDNLENVTDEVLEAVVALDVDYDLRLELTYTDPGTDDGNATLTCHGEDNGVPGVQFEKKAIRVSTDRMVFPVGSNLWATE